MSARRSVATVTSFALRCAKCDGGDFGIRALDAEAEVMRAQILVVVDQGEILGYLDKLAASLRARADLLDRETKG